MGQHQDHKGKEVDDKGPVGGCCFGHSGIKTGELHGEDQGENKEFSGLFSGDGQGDPGYSGKACDGNGGKGEPQACIGK